ncbi:glucose receptor git3 [Diplodia corticola]|uniref:Glucose receptor git3 n=1 Tax=Diplodia corticola TaxID=236234 RepID=A0A1J9RJN5_9PEZI|nr:glucose receptor git3 [Diplodia corticola]OJD40681.1 glucose receptor git3 [Diplodia corticola]
MLLILGDWMRALWYLVFAIVSFRRGTIYTHTRFCQAAGYLIQMATEVSGQDLPTFRPCTHPLTGADFSVLFISIHGATQIFKPPVSIAGGDDRLYTHRHWIYAFILIVPQIFASLPFADSHAAGYLSQGAFCTLPLRPIWYRLALAWVPRLAIWITILGLAIAIYIHVHREFSHFSAAFRRHSTTSTSFLSETLDGSPPVTDTRRSGSPDVCLHRPSFDSGEQATDVASDSAHVVAALRPTHARQISSVDPISEVPNEALLNPNLMTTVSPDGRRNSRVRIEVPAGLVASNTQVEAANSTNKRRSISESLRSWRGSLKEACDNPNSHRSSLPGSVDSGRRSPSRHGITVFTAFLNPGRRASDGAKSTSTGRTRSRHLSATSRAERNSRRRVSDPLEAQMRQKRTHIRRQLRQVFVYPLVYICMWLFPFVALCLTYNSRLVKRPPFLVNTFNNFCLCFIGAVNAVVFSLREKPWRHIDGNPSRCFWSSFCVWRGRDNDMEEKDDHRRPSQRWSGSTCVDANSRPTTTIAADDYRPAVFSTPQNGSQTLHPSTAPPPQPPPPPSSLVEQPPANPESNRDMDNDSHDEDAITPISSPPPPPSAAAAPPPPPRRSTRTIPSPPHPLTSHASFPPRPALLRHASTPPLAPPPVSPFSPSSPSSPSPLPPPGQHQHHHHHHHTANTLTALSLATAARRGIKRASILMAASATAPRETDAQRAAKEMAYERLAWERNAAAATARLNAAAAAAGSSGGGGGGGLVVGGGGGGGGGRTGGPRRGSTGEIVGGGGDGGGGVFNVGSGSESGLELAKSGPGSGSGFGTGTAAAAAGGVGAKEWWEGRGSGCSGGDEGGKDDG